jgi:site-specific DNA recombinase
VRVKDGNKERIKLQLEPTEANVVKSLFDGVIGGKGLIDLVRESNERGIPGPRGRGWGKTGIHEILTNEIHTGTFVWGKNSKRGLDPIRAENACPAIVDRDTYLQVLDVMKKRTLAKTHPRMTASPFLLSGLAYCGYCGKALVARYAKSGKFSYYVCGTLDKKGAAHARQNTSRQINSRR